MQLGGGPGGFRLGLQQYVDQRRAALLSDPEVAATAPSIQGVAASTDVPGASVFITATVTHTGPIASVYLYYQPSPSGQYLRTAMADDGLSGDGAAGDDVYGALLPVVGVAGQKVPYYVGATAQNAYLAQSFAPRRTELDPLILTFAGGSTSGPVVINEFLAKNDSVIQDPAGDYEDYVELYNRGTTTIDLSGMYLTDALTSPTKWQFPSGISIDPGQTLLIWADGDLAEGPLHADFKLSASGEDIGIYDTDGVTPLDTVTFGAQLSDISTGLLEDGGALLVTFPSPTPAAVNDSGSGIRSYDQLDPTAHSLSLAAAGTGAIGTIATLTASNFTANAPTLFAYAIRAATHVVVAGAGHPRGPRSDVHRDGRCDRHPDVAPLRARGSAPRRVGCLLPGRGRGFPGSVLRLERNPPDDRPVIPGGPRATVRNRRGRRVRPRFPRPGSRRDAPCPSCWR